MQIPELDFVAELLKSSFGSSPPNVPPNMDWTVARKWILGHRLMIPNFSTQIDRTDAPKDLK